MKPDIHKYVQNYVYLQNQQNPPLINARYGLEYSQQNTLMNNYTAKMSLVPDG